MSRAPSYTEWAARRTDDVPLDLLDWTDPPPQPIEVEERDLTQAEWALFKRVLEGLK
jgi:hypothetical protein